MQKFKRFGALEEKTVFKSQEFFFLKVAVSTVANTEPGQQAQQYNALALGQLPYGMAKHRWFNDEALVAKANSDDIAEANAGATILMFPVPHEESAHTGA